MEYPAVTFGLGVTSVSGIALAILYYALKRGLKSKCLVAGTSIVLDIHKATAAEGAPSPLKIEVKE